MCPASPALMHLLTFEAPLSAQPFTLNNNKPLSLAWQTRTLTKNPAEKDCSVPLFDHTVCSEGGVDNGISAMS